MPPISMATSGRMLTLGYRNDPAVILQPPEETMRVAEGSTAKHYMSCKLLNNRVRHVTKFNIFLAIIFRCPDL